MLIMSRSGYERSLTLFIQCKNNSVHNKDVAVFSFPSFLSFCTYLFPFYIHSPFLPRQFFYMFALAFSSRVYGGKTRHHVWQLRWHMKLKCRSSLWCSSRKLLNMNDRYKCTFLQLCIRETSNACNDESLVVLDYPGYCFCCELFLQFLHLNKLREIYCQCQGFFTRSISECSFGAQHTKNPKLTVRVWIINDPISIKTGLPLVNMWWRYQASVHVRLSHSLDA